MPIILRIREHNYYTIENIVEGLFIEYVILHWLKCYECEWNRCFIESIIVEQHPISLAHKTQDKNSASIFDSCFLLNF